jgi:PAS domain S-box-containing protein
MHPPEIAIKNPFIEFPQRPRWAPIAASCRGILGTIPAAAYACDASGQITYFNSIAEAIWGRAPRLRDASERYCGSYRLYSMDGRRMRHEECWMALALLQGRPYHGRAIVIERRDGTRTIGKAHAHPLRNDQSQIVGALNLVADITELSGAEAGHSRLHHAFCAYSATMAMIDIAISVLTAIKWKNSPFD